MGFLKSPEKYLPVYTFLEARMALSWCQALQVIMLFLFSKVTQISVAISFKFGLSLCSQDKVGTLQSFSKENLLWPQDL